jgi:multidrug efflux pump subunit AcrA (membrane-fusion protein)
LLKALLEDSMSVLSKYKFWIGGMLGLLVIALIVGAVRPSHVAGANQGAPLDVQVVQVEQKDVPIYGEWIGTLDGLVNADVRAQVTGYLLRQGYQEGALVKKGQLLFEIDPRPFQAALDQAQGQLAQAEAQLATAEAVQVRTQLDVEKYTPLAKQQAASQQDLDNSVQNNLAAKATVENARSKRTRLRSKPQRSISTSRAWWRPSTASLGRPSCRWALWLIWPAGP